VFAIWDAVVLVNFSSSAGARSELSPVICGYVYDVVIYRQHGLRLYGKPTALHFRDSQPPNPEEVKIAVCNCVGLARLALPLPSLVLHTCRRCNTITS
jgi:hypothetical protein